MAYSNTLRSIESPLERIARAISTNWGVRVVFSGSTPRTDGDTIYLPYNSDYLNEDAQHLLHGHLDHETLHMAEEHLAKEAKLVTPMELFKSAKHPVKRMLFNCLEDIRIERKYSAKFIGIGENLDFCNRHATAKHKANIASGAKLPFWHLFGVMLIALKRGQDYSFVPKPVAAWLPVLEAEINAIDNVKTHTDAFHLANRIYEKVIDVCDELSKPEEDSEGKEDDENSLAAPPEASSGSGEDGKGKDGDDDSKSAASSSGEDDSDGDNADADSGVAGDEDGEAGDEGSDSGESTDDSDSEAYGDGDQDSEESSEDNGPVEDTSGEGEVAPRKRTKSKGSSVEDEDGTKRAPAKPSKSDLEECDPTKDEIFTEDIISDTLREDIEKASKRDLKSHKRYVPNPLCQALDEWFKPRASYRSLETYTSDLAVVKEKVNAMRARLLGAMRVLSVSREIGDQQRGTLDPSSLYSLKLGNQRIYSERTKGLELDLAVSVLIDLSGSMGGAEHKISKSYHARLISVALSETFSQLGVEFEVIGFHNNPSRMPRIRGEAEYQHREPFDFLVIKEFAEPLRAARGRFEAITGYYDNADGEAVRLVGRRLAARPEASKMLIVISDGEPMASGCDDSVLYEDLRSAIKELATAGVQVIGFGVLTRAVQKFYNATTKSSHVVIDGLNGMEVAIYKAIKDKFMNLTAKRR